MSKIGPNPPYDFLSIPTLQEESYFKSLLEECISPLVHSTEEKSDEPSSYTESDESNATSASEKGEHKSLKAIEDYLRITREVTIDGEETLKFLNDEEIFHICDMTENPQYWLVVVEKVSFVVRCEVDESLPPDNASSLRFFKMKHHNIAPICLDTAKSMMVRTNTNDSITSDGQSNKSSQHNNATIMEGTFTGPPIGPEYVIEDVLMYSGKLLVKETLTQRFEKIKQIIKNYRSLKMQRGKDKPNEHSKFAFEFRGKHYSKNVTKWLTKDRPLAYRHLEKFWEGFEFCKPKGKYQFCDGKYAKSDSCGVMIRNDKHYPIENNYLLNWKFPETFFVQVKIPVRSSSNKQATPWAWLFCRSDESHTQRAFKASFTKESWNELQKHNNTVIHHDVYGADQQTMYNKGNNHSYALNRDSIVCQICYSKDEGAYEVKQVLSPEIQMGFLKEQGRYLRNWSDTKNLKHLCTSTIVEAVRVCGNTFKCVGENELKVAFGGVGFQEYLTKKKAEAEKKHLHTHKIVPQGAKVAPKHMTPNENYS